MHSAQINLDDLGLTDVISREYMHHHGICPLRRADDGSLIVAAAPNARQEALDELELVTGVTVCTQEMTADEVERLIERLSTEVDRSADHLESESYSEDTMADVRDLANQKPVRRYWGLLARDAFDMGASDIHLEMTPHGLSVRFRKDGLLVPAPDPPTGFSQAIVSLIKLEAKLDIAECRRPQDGRIRIRLESGELDLRVSTVPTMHGESVALRLLDRGGRPVQLQELGMPAEVLAQIERLARRPHGMLLATGPTGSGKTTTLYAALLLRQREVEKIITVEDPVEYRLAGITQVPVHRHAGITFASALRSILRQDPDVIMIGEMRDPETAEIAIQSAMTGHLVFSTLHTNDSLSAVPRLMDLGVPAYLVAATVEGILAQRLVRRICDGCRASYSPDPERLALIAARPVGRARLERGTGCAACRGTGFSGRVGLFEFLIMTDEIRDAVTRGASRAELRCLAEANGWRTLRTDAMAKVDTGITTVEEVLRVL